MCALVTGVQTCALPIWAAAANRDAGPADVFDEPVEQLRIAIGQRALQVVDGEARVDRQHLVPIAAGFVVMPATGMEAGEIEARHVRVWRKRQPSLEGGLGLVEATERHPGPSQEQPGQGELAAEPGGPELESHGLLGRPTDLPSGAAPCTAIAAR